MALLEPQMKLWRRLFASVNLVIVLVLLGVLFIFANYLSSQRYATWDVTRSQITKLSGKTRQTLNALKEPVSVTVFYQPNHRLYQMVGDLLKEYEEAAPRLTITFVDPEQDAAKAAQLADQFHIKNPNVVIFASGNRHKYLTDTDLADLEYGEMAAPGQPPSVKVKAFKGEEAFTSAIISLTQSQAPLVWFVTGHGEKSVEAPGREGISAFKQSLEQQNMTTQSVTLLERAAIPPDAKLIVIAGPTHRFVESEIGLLHTYLDAGGRLLVMIDPLQDTGLEPLLARWGMTVDRDIVVDPSLRLPFVSAANLLVIHYTDHPIVEKMQTVMTIFPLARSIRPAGAIPKELTVTALASTSAAGWGEMDTANETFQFEEGKDVKGPVSVAVAAERSSAVPAASRARIVAIGDSDFMMNAQLDNVGNKDFLMGAVFWLINQEPLIGIGPKVPESLKLRLTEPLLIRLSWTSVLAMPLLCSLLGTGVWLVRRN